MHSKNYLRKLSDLELVKLRTSSEYNRSSSIEVLIERHDKLLWNFVWRFKGMLARSESFDAEDLFLVAKSGLIVAYDKFDPLKNVKFTTYCYYWVLQSVKRYVESNNGVIRLPAGVVTNMKLLDIYENDFESIMKDKNVKQSALERAEFAKGINVDSYDRSDFVEEEGCNYSFEEDLLDEIEAGKLLEMVDNLNELQRSVIIGNFGLYGANTSSALVKKKYNLSESSYRKILKEALLELKKGFGKS